MTISRANMGSQLKGNRMYKKVKKKGKGGDILGSLSPLYGIMSGKGAFGKLADAGLSPAGMLAKEMREKGGKGKQRVAVAKEGGRMGRGDGCCVRGKTKGTMR